MSSLNYFNTSFEHIQLLEDDKNYNNNKLIHSFLHSGFLLSHSDRVVYQQIFTRNAQTVNFTKCESETELKFSFD